MPRRRAISLCAILALGAPMAATRAAGEPLPTGSEGAWGLCRPQTIPISGPQGQMPLTDLPRLFQRETELGPPPPGEEATRFNADRLSSQQGAVSTFAGNVVITQSTRRLESERADYDKRTDVLDVTGKVRYYTPNLFLQGERGRFNLGQDSGWLSEGEFRVPEAHAYGEARKITVTDPQHTDLDQATYTTCNPDHIDWQLTASRMELDEETNTGEAYNTTVSFKGVPFFYTPYINFPLKGRKSGFLAPSYGTSTTNGTDVSVPYYWNIAPNRDATTTPRQIENRGTMLLSEFRYLNPASAGRINYDYLPDDTLYGDDRYYLDLTHRAQPADRWRLSVDYKEVSDVMYFNDLDRSINNTSTTHLDRTAEADYLGDYWTFRGRVQDYQTLSGAPPYKRLPQLVLDGRDQTVQGEPSYDFHGELVRFQHEEDDKVQGDRVDMEPSISLPLESMAWFLTPRLAWRYTSYQLQDTGPDQEETLQRSLPIASVDAGIYLERELSLAGRSLQQTLEPRLYYLYVPYENQDDLPRFDTGLYGFSFSQLFRENRFNGADRVGDANQVTAALTTRFIDTDSGQEYLRASVGEIFYLQDRRVTLNGGTPETTSQSSVAAELAASPVEGFDFRGTVQWDPYENITEQSNYRLQYKKDERRIFAAAYRTRYPDQREADVALFWPLSRHWHFIGRWYYDLEEETALEDVVGLEYDSCCWSLRLVSRTRPVALEDGTFEDDHSYMFTFTLKGLATLGRRLEDELQEGVLGYGQ